MSFAKVHVRFYAFLFYVFSLASIIVLPFDIEFRHTWLYFIVLLCFGVMISLLSIGLWKFNWHARYGVQLLAGFGAVLFIFMLFSMNDLLDIHKTQNVIWIVTFFLYIYAGFIMNRYERLFLGY